MDCSYVNNGVEAVAMAGIGQKQKQKRFTHELSLDNYEKPIAQHLHNKDQFS